MKFDNQSTRGRRWVGKLAAISVFFCSLSSTLAAAMLPSQITMDALVHGQRIQGTPLAWSNEKVILLGATEHCSNSPPARRRTITKPLTALPPIR